MTYTVYEKLNTASISNIWHSNLKITWKRGEKQNDVPVIDPVVVSTFSDPYFDTFDPYYFLFSCEHNVLWCYQSTEQRIQTAAVKARGYLEAKLPTMTNEYSLAITTYALVLAQSTMAETALHKLNGRAINKGKRERRVHREYYSIRVFLYGKV